MHDVDNRQETTTAVLSKKSLTLAQADYASLPALSGQVHQNYYSFFRHASFPLRDAGIFLCRFLGNRPKTCRCRSPPPSFRSLVHLQPKRRYL